MGIDAQRKKAERREAREAMNREEKLKRKIERKNNVKPKWRRLNDGGVAFGDKFKINPLINNKISKEFFEIIHTEKKSKAQIVL